MDRVNFPLTIDQLIIEAQKAKAQFGGDKYILISDDEEGNGFHECYYSFSNAKENIEGCGVRHPYDLNLEDCVVLG